MGGHTPYRGQVEQHSARTTQQDPHGDGTRDAPARRGSRLPHPAPPAHEREPQREGYEVGRQAVATYGARRGSTSRAADERAPSRGSSRASGRPSAESGARPAPRLTGLGTGVFAGLLMMLFGWLEGALFDGAPAFYGVLFVLVCAVAALWVRPAELYAAPVIAPLAYTVGQFFAGGSGEGLTGVLQNVFTSLALHAAWLYAGTLTAALIVLVRKAVLAVRQRRQRREAVQQRPEGR